MPTGRRFELCVSFIGVILLCGCGTHRTSLSTAPLGKSEAAAEAAVPDTSQLDVSTSPNHALASTLGGPIGGLDANQLARFRAGQDEFEDVDDIEEGLGPVFNEASCATCHTGPVGGTNGRVETRFGRRLFGRFDPLTELGGSLLQDHAIGLVENGGGRFTFAPEVVPAEANVTAGRITTQLFGLGLVDPVPDAALLGLAWLEASLYPYTRGTPSFVTEVGSGRTRVGRFGWKAQVATLRQFSGDAYVNEMGITNPQFPDENAPQGNAGALAFNPLPTLNNDGEAVAQFTDFMTFLGPPPRGPRSLQTIVGGQVFLKVGCANCHTPRLTTGRSPVAALSYRVFQPFSDFLLHDMGTLGDGIVQGRASGRQMRTAPLWGLASRTLFLHDGRANTVEAAILGHDGQGSYARERFSRLGFGERGALLAFLRSL